MFLPSIFVDLPLVDDEESGHSLSSRDLPDFDSGDATPDPEIFNVQRAMVSAVDEQTRSRLIPWFEQYRASQKMGGSISDYEFLSFDDDLILDVKHGREDRFRFRVNEKHDYEIVVDSIFEFDGGWIMSGYISGRSDMSEATLYVHEDGTRTGDVFIKGVGRFIVTPTGQLPAHAVYLRNAEFAID